MLMRRGEIIVSWPLAPARGLAAGLIPAIPTGGASLLAGVAGGAFLGGLTGGVACGVANLLDAFGS